MTIIAEVKTQSPFGYSAPQSWDELFEVANSVGDIISIHTDPRWGGSFDLIAKARSLTNKPILAKGIHARDSDVAQALSRGADMVLVVGRIPQVHRDKCLLEPNTLAELQTYPSGTKVAWNARDLATGQPKTETFAQARTTWTGWLCQASLIATIDDVSPSADAVLVGTHLFEFAKSLKRDLVQ